MVHSLMTGKKKTFFNGEMINEAQKVTKEWAFAWSFGAHLMRVGINFEEYSLVIDGVPFRRCVASMVEWHSWLAGEGGHWLAGRDFRSSGVHEGVRPRLIS